jgi:hypothetical protein
MTVSLPTTKQARRMFTAAMKRHNVEVVKTKTRDKVSLSGIDYDLWVKLYRDDTIRSKLRTVEFHVTYEDMNHLADAMSEFESMMLLSGKLFDNRKSWKYRYGSNCKIIKVLSILL